MKRFVPGEPIEFQREPSSAWERGSYVAGGFQRGWHRVKLADDAPPNMVMINSKLSLPSRRIGVPTRRLRHVGG